MLLKIYKTLASAKLTLFLFLTLAVSSIFGTLVQQGLPRERYAEVYGPGPASLIEFFHISDLYHSWWFVGLLLLLALNITVCTARRIPALFRQIRSRDRNGGDDIFRSAPITRTLACSGKVDEIEQKARTLLRSLAGKPVHAARDGKSYLFAERGRYTRLGMVAIHASILLILAGGLIGSIWGFSGQMRINEGASSNTVALYGGETRTLPVALACDDFSVTFYENGMPREYRSDVTIFEGGKKVLSATIRVNEPLKYKGLKFCQATYGIAEASGFTVVMREAATGKENPVSLELMKKVPVPGTEAFFAAARFAPDFQGRGPALLGVLLQPGTPHDIFWIPRDQPVKRGGHIFAFTDFTARFYTGLQVGSDPGVPLVWAGFLLILAGFAAVFLGAHRRVWMRITPSAEGGEVLIAADPGKNRKGFEERLDKAFRTMCAA